MNFIGSFAMLSFSLIILLFLMGLLYSKKGKRTSQLSKLFGACLLCMFIWILSLMLQILFQNTSVNPVLFEGFASFGACFIPIALLLLGISFSNTKIHFSWKYLLLLIVPTITTILMFTNSSHHLFYKTYSTNLDECVTGPYAIVHSLYSYTLIAIGLIYLLRYSIKNSGFFSKQSVLILVGSLIPVVINILGTFRIVSISAYITPVSFTITTLFYAFAIFKFDFLKVAPIALQKIVDRMSDSYIVLNEDMVITDFNQTLLDTFKLSSNQIRNVNIIDILKKFPGLNVDVEVFISAVNKTKLDNSTYTIEKHWKSINKYFHIEINSIKNNNSFLGTLILLKDVTQHNLDMQTIKDNQEILIEKERLASLGQMIGGIAHNLKTPIMSISGAAEGMSDLIKEYRQSTGDPEVTVQDHQEIANDMDDWVKKIRTHLSYMSDIITAVKGQAVAFSDNMFNGFTVGELVKHVDILMKHELKNALITLNTSVNIDENTSVNGNINSLVQVINNMISNAIQAYKGKVNKDIFFRLYQENNNLVISIEDFAGGLPEKVQDKLFKEMVTTKGKNGTGLGLFMSYSNIKAHFNGNMRYETQKGKGTTFYIEIPLSV